MIKRSLILFLAFTMFFCCAYKKPHKYIIKAAIQEFKIAISLSPSTQASAVFYNNLGETYIFIGYPDMAKDCFEKAIQFYGLNLKYHQNLVNCYKLLNITNSKIKELSCSKNVYDKIQLGILFIETNQTRRGVNTLDEICNEEPDLLITPALRQYIAQVIKAKL